MRYISHKSARTQGTPRTKQYIKIDHSYLKQRDTYVGIVIGLTKNPHQ